MVDTGIAVSSGMSTLFAFVSAFILLRHYRYFKFSKPTNFWAVAMFFYGIGHFIVTLLYAGILENSVLVMFIYVNLSGAVTMGLFLYGTLFLFTKNKSVIHLIPLFYSGLYFLGSLLYGFIIPDDSILNFINLSGNFTQLTNMSWFVVEILIPASFFISILFFIDFYRMKDQSSFWVSINFFLYFILLFIWPVPELKLLFYTGRTLATGCLLIGFSSLTQKAKIEGIIEELETAESNFFLDLLSHDIKNYLHTVKTIMEVPEGENDVLESSDYKSIINKNIDSILKLILNVERYRTVQKEKEFQSLTPYQLDIAIKEALSNVISSQPSLEITYNFGTNNTMDYWVYANEFIKDLFVNLFSNSVKHNNKEKTHIDISIDSFNLRGDDFWVILISDNGPGIPEDKKKHIFTGKLRKNGSGIGLSIVKNIVDRYGGNILVKDNRNKHGEINGSTFELQLPKANISQNDKFYSS